MDINWLLQTLAGGALAGLGAGSLLLVNGRVAGISGILSGALLARGEERAWRLLFLGGLLVGALGAAALMARSFETLSGRPALLMIVAGFCIGLGSRLGSGCTSGHSLCGIGRRSMRSVVATLIFFVSGAVTVQLVKLAKLLGGAA